MLKNPKNNPDESLLYFISSLTNKVKITEAYRRGGSRPASNISRRRVLTARAAPIEDLNFKNDGKIMLLITIVVMAYVLSLREAFESGSLKQKVHRDGSSSMAVSFFRQGITSLRRHVQSLVIFIRYLETIAQTLRTPKWVHVQ